MQAAIKRPAAALRRVRQLPPQRAQRRSMHGIMRVRGFTQDDGHIFCTEEQILPEECLVVHGAAAEAVYKDFGFTDIIYKVATRPENARIGSDEIWDKAEAALIASPGGALAVEVVEVAPGDGAFYGPKIEYTLKDATGPAMAAAARCRSTSTMAQRLGAEYVAESGEPRTSPVMLHRAIVGSLERFIGILIEQHAGALAGLARPACRWCVLRHHRSVQADYVAERSSKALADVKDCQRSTSRFAQRERSPIKSASIHCKRFRSSSSLATRKRQAGAVAVRARGNRDLGVMPRRQTSQREARGGHRLRRSDVPRRTPSPRALARWPAGSAVCPSRAPPPAFCVLILPQDSPVERHLHHRYLCSTAGLPMSSANTGSIARDHWHPMVRLNGPENEPLGVVSLIAEALRLSERVRRGSGRDRRPRPSRRSVA